MFNSIHLLMLLGLISFFGCDQIVKDENSDETTEKIEETSSNNENSTEENNESTTSDNESKNNGNDNLEEVFEIDINIASSLALGISTSSVETDLGNTNLFGLDSTNGFNAVTNFPVDEFYNTSRGTLIIPKQSFNLSQVDLKRYSIVIWWNNRS